MNIIEAIKLLEDKPKIRVRVSSWEKNTFLFVNREKKGGIIGIRQPSKKDEPYSPCLADIRENWEVLN